MNCVSQSRAALPAQTVQDSLKTLVADVLQHIQGKSALVTIVECFTACLSQTARRLAAGLIQSQFKTIKSDVVSAPAQNVQCASTLTKCSAQGASQAALRQDPALVGSDTTSCATFARTSEHKTIHTSARKRCLPSVRSASVLSKPQLKQLRKLSGGRIILLAV